MLLTLFIGVLAVLGIFLLIVELATGLVIFLDNRRGRPGRTPPKGW